MVFPSRKNDYDGESSSSLPMTPVTAATFSRSSSGSNLLPSLPPSPFFKPTTRTPVALRPVSTPGGTKKLRAAKVKDLEKRSGVTGATFNLINTIVGAGIVGIPFAIREAGLVSGVGMVILCAALTVKSLRLLIETAKHIDVPSYETLCEASFGRFGFLFISISMFANAYGAMVSYLMIVKATLPRLLGVAISDAGMKRAVLAVSSFCVILPLSTQRDMANLAKTSVLSVCFDCIMVLIVAWKSPASQSIEEAGGFQEVVRSSTLRPDTFFIGLGVLSFAFVCQHGAFIIAGSLKRPTKERWARVATGALVACGILATTNGAIGYLGYMEDTDGNVLNNLGNDGLSRLARALMCCAMFFVYPMESFVARHICVVLLFEGRKAHDGDDHAVLARRDRRIALTAALYLLALVPAMMFDDLGSILAVSGSVGGSSLSYLGPGACYLAIHGDEFLELVRKGMFGHRLGGDGSSDEEDGRLPPTGIAALLNALLYYALLMPLWIAIAELGQRNLASHEEREALKSPHPNRLGKIVHKLPRHHHWVNTRGVAQKGGALGPCSSGEDEEGVNGEGEMTPLVRHNSMPGGGTAYASPAKYASPAGYAAASRGGKVMPPPPQLGGKAVGNRGIAAAIAAKSASNTTSATPSWDEEDEEGEDDPQEYTPTLWDFVTAILFMIFGAVAMTAGMWSVLMSGGDAPVGGRRLIFEV